MKPGTLVSAELHHEVPEERFRRLAELWKEDTLFSSSTTEMALHPAYQQIIGLGSQAIPWILRELAHDPGHWFWALKAITGEDPAPESAQGRLNELAEAWLRWG